MHKEANISGCVHTFCFECIEEWAKNTNTCPMCKCEFNNIKEKQNAAHVRKVKRKVQIAEYDEDELERLNVAYEDYGGDDGDEDDEDDDDDNKMRGYSSRDGFVVADDTIEYEDDEDNDDDDDEEESESGDESVASETETEDDGDNGKDDDEIEIVRFVVDGFEMPKSSIYKRRRSEEESVVETRKSKRIALLSN